MRSTIEEPVGQIASQARGIPDEVQRLRYLRERVVLAPMRGRWRMRVPSPAAAAIAFITILMGTAILIWILT